MPYKWCRQTGLIFKNFYQGFFFKCRNALSWNRYTTIGSLQKHRFTYRYLYDWLTKTVSFIQALELYLFFFAADGFTGEVSNKKRFLYYRKYLLYKIIFYVHWDIALSQRYDRIWEMKILLLRRYFFTTKRCCVFSRVISSG